MNSFTPPAAKTDRERRERNNPVPAALDRLRSFDGDAANSFSGGAPQPQQNAVTQPTPSALKPDNQPDADPAHGIIWEHPRSTDFAGFLFIVGLLNRLGIADTLATHPQLNERAWPETLLLRLARRLGISRDDPAVAWLSPTDDTLASSDRPITAAWLRMLRAQTRRHAGLSLTSICRRAGSIVATRTHVDVLMHFSQADIAVRRAGLDIDPGWLPWLGRVIQFHYMDTVPHDDA